MRECNYCGKPLARRKEKGGREREYCTDVCRQLAYRARHPEKRYVESIMRGIRTERWKEDPRLMPWQTLLEEANKHIERLKNDVLLLEGTNSLLRCDIHNRDEELSAVWWKLADAQAEIVRLNVLLDSQSKRKR